jgi:hypothetical protein
MAYRNERKDYSAYWWGAVFAAAALFLGVLVYATAPGINTASNTTVAPRPSPVR